MCTSLCWPEQPQPLTPQPCPCPPAPTCAMLRGSTPSGDDLENILSRPAASQPAEDAAHTLFHNALAWMGQPGNSAAWA